MIRFLNQQCDFTLKHKLPYKTWIKKVVSDISNHSMRVGDVNIVFCSDNYLLSVNREFLKHNYYTDIITFDYNHSNVLSGDLLISIDTVRANSLEYNVPFEEELHRVIIHGVLHLLGFGDANHEEKIIMTSMENRALDLLLK
jgi:probable rRNA maturation factor